MLCLENCYENQSKTQIKLRKVQNQSKKTKKKRKSKTHTAIWKRIAGSLVSIAARARAPTRWGRPWPSRRRTERKRKRAFAVGRRKISGHLGQNQRRKRENRNRKRVRRVLRRRRRRDSASRSCVSAVAAVNPSLSKRVKKRRKRVKNHANRAKIRTRTDQTCKTKNHRRRSMSNKHRWTRGNAKPPQHA